MIKSTILIKDTTRERLKNRGIKGETYDSLINRLLDHEGKSTNNRNGNLKLKELVE